MAETLGIWVSVSRDGDGQYEFDASGGHLIRRVTYLNADNEEKRIIVTAIEGSGVGQDDEAGLVAAELGILKHDKVYEQALGFLAVNTATDS